MKEKVLTTFYIVRHGQAEGNQKGLLQGHNDTALTPVGEAQAQEVTKNLEHIHFDEIFSSDLIRAKRTAEVIALERKLAVKTTQALREKKYGQFQGLPYQTINTAIEQLLKTYKEVTDETLFILKPTPDVESDEEAMGRFITFLREVAVGFRNKIILVVTHSGMMRSLLIHLGFGTYKTIPVDAIKLTAYIKLESDGVDFFVKETRGVNKT